MGLSSGSALLRRDRSERPPVSAALEMWFWNNFGVQLMITDYAWAVVFCLRRS
jgi:hypothetical protein